MKILLWAAVVAIGFCPSASLAKPMAFELVGTGGNCSGCEWIAADGEIEIDSAEKLEAYFETAGLDGFGYHVQLHSPGGNLFGGMKLGELFRSREFSTGVAKTVPYEDSGTETTETGECASACAFAFIGGVSRDTAEGRVGVHQFYDAQLLTDPSAKVFSSLDVSSNQLIGAVVTDYIFRMGVDPRFGAIASGTTPSEMHWFDTIEANICG